MIRGKKIIVYFIILIAGISIGFGAAALFHRNQRDQQYNPMNHELKNAMPETMGTQSVNQEFLTLLTDMRANHDSLFLHKAFFTDENRSDATVYPSKTADDAMFEAIASLLKEYEWRANRTLSSFDASDFDLFIEIYSPGMTQVLTFYKGYNIVRYRDERNETSAYYSYLFTEGDNNADLAVRLLREIIEP